MERLSPADLVSRLAFDWRVLSALRSPHLGALHAFASADDARAGRALTPRDGEAGHAACYAVEYRLPVLVGPGKTVPTATVWFDLLAGGRYPLSDPFVTCTSRPLPWSPHVNQTSGSVCIGDGWRRARGRMLAAQLVVHVLHILNFDEPDRGPDYVGWSATAAHHWRTVLNGRPLTPDLAYPVLPVEITHAVEPEDTGFEALTSFRPRPDDGFTPIGRSR